MLIDRHTATLLSAQAARWDKRVSSWPMRCLVCVKRCGFTCQPRAHTMRTPMRCEEESRAGQLAPTSWP